MGTLVKICGIASEEDARQVAALRPDAMGFVFWKRSPRAVTPEQVAGWVPHLPPEILRVGVFVDEEAAFVMGCLENANLQVAQLHGNESPEYAAGLGATVWKVLHLDHPGGVPAEAYRVDAFLLDSYSAEAPGGTGCIPDWDKARAFIQSCSTPVLLAGGLTPENVREAVERLQPWGVDVSSGVEARPGKKDIDRVRRFIERCRNL